MNAQWKRIAPGKRLFALLLAVMAIFLASAIRTGAQYLISCASLLFAWHLAFIPAPPLKTPLGDVYDASLRGWRTPMTGKLVSLLGIVLLVTGIAMQI
ncbi:hypothetical protein [Frateuria sp.]|uniref:hypothetical protein n=1 Tax=Frateuria sp. TaxID=2211372 RepID=UPI003F8107D7